MLVLRLRPLAFATFLVWRLRTGVCGVGACDSYPNFELCGLRFLMPHPAPPLDKMGIGGENPLSVKL